MDIKKLLLGTQNCNCGKIHTCPIDHVIINDRAIDSLLDVSSDYKNVLLVSDQNTFNVCGKQVLDKLKDKIQSNLILQSEGAVIIPNEQAIERISTMVTCDTDLIIGVGSGVINDLCKFVSFQKNLPYFIVATAPSMDGYASVGSALILDGMKVTKNARPPKAIIADTNVIKNAPIQMLKAGYGDIIGKFSCLNDWKLSALINGEYFCQMVYDLTYNTAQEVQGLAKKVLARDPQAITVLMEALVVIGIAMSYVNCSRPASGSEHHLSHFFEITGILEQKDYFSHGIDVAYSCVETAKIRDKIIKSTPLLRHFDRDNWMENVKRIYGICAEGVITLQDKLGWYNVNNSSQVYSKWNQIKDILLEAPTEKEFIKMLDEIELPYSDFVKLYGENKILDAMLYGKDLKDRYTVLWLNYEYFR